MAKHVSDRIHARGCGGLAEGSRDNSCIKPPEPSRHRKHLRPNQLAEWELRIGDFRVFYDVDLDESLVKIEAIGYKEGSTLFVHGEEYEL